MAKSRLVINFSIKHEEQLASIGMRILEQTGGFYDIYRISSSYSNHSPIVIDSVSRPELAGDLKNVYLRGTSISSDRAPSFLHFPDIKSVIKYYERLIRSFALTIKLAEEADFLQ